MTRPSSSSETVASKERTSPRSQAAFSVEPFTAFVKATDDRSVGKVTFWNNSAWHIGAQALHTVAHWAMDDRFVGLRSSLFCTISRMSKMSSIARGGTFDTVIDCLPRGTALVVLVGVRREEEDPENNHIACLVIKGHSWVIGWRQKVSGMR